MLCPTFALFPLLVWFGAPVSSSKMHRRVASLFGVGLFLARMGGSSSGSGTLGAAIGLGAALLVGLAGWVPQLVLAVLLAGLSIWSSRPFPNDPPWVVIDEAAGAVLAVVGLGQPGLVVGWVVFRIVDIFKGMPGVRWAERLPGGWGVTCDDLIAGGYGLAAGWVVQLWIV